MGNILELAKRSARSNELAQKIYFQALKPFATKFPHGIFFFHQGRSGSTVLADLLGQHPNIESCGEVFAQFKKRVGKGTPQSHLYKQRAMALPRHALVEAKFFDCQHPSQFGMQVGEFVSTVKQLGFSKFIVLNRKNYLRKVLSESIGKNTGAWNYEVGSVVPQKTAHLDVNAIRILGKVAPMLDLFEYMDSQYDLLLDLLKSDPVLEITYEDDILQDPIAGYKRVCDWLDFEDAPVQVKLKKMSNLRLSDSIENWQEVENTLSCSKYEWMLYD